MSVALATRPGTNGFSRRCHFRSTLVAALLMAAFVTVGCASNTISLRSVPKSPLVAELDLASYSGPKASARTTQLLRVYNLSDELGTDFRPVLQKLQAINDRRAVGRQRLCPVGVGLSGRQEGRGVRQGRGVGPLRRVGPARLRLSFRRPAGRHAKPVRSELSPRLRSVQRRVGGGPADRLRNQGTRAQHHEDNPHGLRRMGYYLRASRAAAGGRKISTASSSSPTTRSRDFRTCI